MYKRLREKDPAKKPYHVLLRFFCIRYNPDKKCAYITAHDDPKYEEMLQRLIKDKKRALSKDERIEYGRMMEKLRQWALTTPEFYDPLMHDSTKAQMVAAYWLAMAVNIEMNWGIPVVTPNSWQERPDRIDIAKELKEKCNKIKGNNVKQAFIYPTWQFTPGLATLPQLEGKPIGVTQAYLATCVDTYPWSMLPPACYGTDPLMTDDPMQWAEKDAHRPPPIIKCPTDKDGASLCTGRVHRLDCMIFQKCHQEYGPKSKYCPVIKTPYWHHYHSFISGGSVKGVVDTLAATVRTKTKTSADPCHVVTAIMRVLRAAEANGRGKTPIPEISVKSIEKVEHLPSKSAGFWIQQRWDEALNDFVTEVVNGCQGNVIDCARLKLREIARRVAEAIKNGGVYSKNWFPQLIAKLAVKPEVRKPGADPFKTRVFFIMSVIKLLIDKMLFRTGMEHSYGKGGNGISHKWVHGGAEKLYREMRGMSKKIGYLEYDVEKMDQSLLGQVLVLICWIPYWMSKHAETRTEEINERIFEAFCSWSADDTAVTLIKWMAQEARWIIGVMFSGMFITSYGDTIYIMIAMFCFEMYSMEWIGRTQGRDAAEEFKKHWRRRENYGDDGLDGFLKRDFYIYSSEPMSNKAWPDRLDKYLTEVWGLSLKKSDTHFFVEGDECFLTELRSYPLNPSYYGAEGMQQIPGGMAYYTKIVKDGPKFLQRRFVRRVVNGEELIMPYRPATDYYVRAGTSANPPDATDPLRWVIRWRAQKIDTCGNDGEAWTFLDKLETKFRETRMINDIEADLRARLSQTEWSERLRKLGFDENLEIGMDKSREDVFDMFRWDRNWQITDTALRGTDFYDKYGIKIPRDKLEQWG